jgi:hypothetical protein
MFVDVDVRNVGLYRGETVFEKNEFVAEATRTKIATALVNHLAKAIDYDI